jgi:hypothetical protein
MLNPLDDLIAEVVLIVKNTRGWAADEEKIHAIRQIPGSLAKEGHLRLERDLREFIPTGCVMGRAPRGGSLWAV